MGFADGGALRLTEACKARNAMRLSQEGGWDVAAIGQNPAHSAKKKPRGTRMIPMRTPQRNLRIPCPSSPSNLLSDCVVTRVGLLPNLPWLGKPSHTCETCKRQDDYAHRRSNAKFVSAGWGAEFRPFGPSEANSFQQKDRDASHRLQRNVSRMVSSCFQMSPSRGSRDMPKKRFV
jgi:hypothetical protein